MNFANLAWYLIPVALFTASILINEKTHKNGKEKNTALKIVAIIIASLSLLSTMIISFFIMGGLSTGNV